MLSLLFRRSGFKLSLLFILCWTVGCAHKIILPGKVSDFSGGSLSLVHFNDGASRLLNAGVGVEDYGGVARFATLVENLKKKSLSGATSSDALITVSAGNDFLAGQIFNVSLRKGVPFYDSTALDMIGIDALLIAGHSFDMGPDVFADYIAGFQRTHPVFLTANLDFTREPTLRAAVDDGKILPSTIIERGGFKFGLIGISPANIAENSSPRRIVAHGDLPSIVQKRIDAFLEIGVKRIILIANFDSFEEVTRLIGSTSGIDVAVVGASSHCERRFRACLKSDISLSSYPQFVADVSGRNVVVVGTPGGYCFAGFLKVRFDSSGEVAAIDSISGVSKVVPDGAPNAVLPDPTLNRDVVIPLAKALSTTSHTLAVSNVRLDGAVDRETNLGDIVADSVLWRSTVLSKSYGAPLPTVALLDSSLFKAGLPKGPVSEADVFSSFSSCSSLSILEGISPRDLKLTLERMFGGARNSRGNSNLSFPQIAGMKIVFNPTHPQGAMVKSVRLDTGDALVLNYKVVPYAPKVNVATVGELKNEFGARRNGESVSRTNIGEFAQNAVIAFLSASDKVGGLNGRVSSRKYPDTALRRIMVTRE